MPQGHISITFQNMFIDILRSRLEQIHDLHNTHVYFPFETSLKSEVLLVYDPFTLSASLSLEDKAKHLEETSKEIFKIVDEVVGVTSTKPATEQHREACTSRSEVTVVADIRESATELDDVTHTQSACLPQPLRSSLTVPTHMYDTIDQLATVTIAGRVISPYQDIQEEDSEWTLC